MLINRLAAAMCVVAFILNIDRGEFAYACIDVLMFALNVKCILRSAQVPNEP